MQLLAYREAGTERGHCSVPAESSSCVPLARLEDDDPPAERRHVDGRAGRAVWRVEAEAAAMPVGVPVDVEVEQESDLPLEAHLWSRSDLGVVSSDLGVISEWSRSDLGVISE